MDMVNAAAAPAQSAVQSTLPATANSFAALLDTAGRRIRTNTSENPGITEASRGSSRFSYGDAAAAERDGISALDRREIDRRSVANQDAIRRGGEESRRMLADAGKMQTEMGMLLLVQATLLRTQSGMNQLLRGA
jgi:hypothetical protein